ncbi:BMP family ABC transporter substrate-binding protein [Humitalea sp. 24SJ18S-53]|uniref:BMP family ABC transporter substrate-binding protein n=1 Tax=Humitalea sp. 24SJ18S-53 TaxID=3422307 RepID=UPI003D679BAF
MAPRVALVCFGQPGAGSFNAAGEAGLARAAAAHPIAARVLWQADPARRAATLAAAAATSDLVIAHGGQGEAATAAVAPDFPNVRFAVTQGRIAGPSIACFEVLQEHSAFLAGALAGWWTQGGVVGHLSGEPVPPGLRGRAAFAAGLAHANPGARLLTGFCGNQHDASLTRAWTAAQCAAGMDVQFAMLDGGRSGATDALRSAGARAIGNVLDWTDPAVAAPGGDLAAIRPGDPVFVASAVADNGWAVVAAVEAFCAGNFSDLRAGIGDQVRLALAGDVPPALADRLAVLATDIASGRLAVPEAYDGPEWRPG